MLVLARGCFGPAPARVLEQVRRAGPVTREDLARATGLSLATVARAVNSLVGELFLTERPDLVAPGQIGRPSIPLDLDTGRHVALGVHVGRRITTVGLVSLDGRVVTQSRLPTSGTAAELVEAVRHHAIRLLAEAEDRRVLTAGLVAPWGEVAYDEAELAALLTDQTGLAVSTAHHVAAVAAAEFLGRRRSGLGSHEPGCTAYVYARDSAGLALAHDVPERTEISRVASLAHFPTTAEQKCACGRIGCVSATATDSAVAQQARDLGVVGSADIGAVLQAARGGDPRASALLHERARLLGETTAVLRDMVDPDELVLVGQAFTGFPPALDTVRETFAATTTLPPLELSFTRFGAGVQAAAAGVAGLGPVFEDPLAQTSGADTRTASR